MQRITSAPRAKAMTTQRQRPGAAKVKVPLWNGTRAPWDKAHAEMQCPLDNEDMVMRNWFDVSRETKAIATSTPTMVKRWDAPEIEIDFYSNPLSWSTSDRIAVGLADRVYHKPNQGSEDTQSLRVTSTSSGTWWTSCVSWAPSARHLFASCSPPSVRIGAVTRGDAAVGAIFDVETDQRVWRVDLDLPRDAVWTSDHVAYIGTRPGRVLRVDLRSKAEPDVFYHCDSELSRLQWNAAGTRLAIGTNTSRQVPPPLLVLLFQNVPSSVHVVDGKTARSPMVLGKFKAAVKAIAWHGLKVAVGTGTADRKLATFDDVSGKELASVGVESQIVGVHWSPNGEQVLTARGWDHAILELWQGTTLKRQCMQQNDKFKDRAFATALSPGGIDVCVAVGDSLQFWNVWEPQKKQAVSSVFEKFVVR